MDTPIDVVLFCPNCGVQHIDAPEAFGEGGDCIDGGWTNPPHRSHLCHNCGHIWRPADVPTNGVLAVKTKGKNDSPVVLCVVRSMQQVPAAIRTRRLADLKENKVITDPREIARIFADDEKADGGKS